MPIPTVTGVIRRRLLINFAVEPDVVARLIPPPFRPIVVQGKAVAGVCLIGLAQMRPKGLPAAFGLASENAAYRIAVSWERDGKSHEGVFVPRRNTNSRLILAAGRAAFRGAEGVSEFTVAEDGDAVAVRLCTGNEVEIDVAGSVSPTWHETSVFSDLEEASEFFRRGSIGYSPGEAEGVHEGVELDTPDWRVEPLAIERLASRFFDDRERFPDGAATFDSALIMRDVKHEWRPVPPIHAQ